MVSCSQDGDQSNKMACASLRQSGITPKIMVEIASNLGRRGTLRPTSIFFLLWPWCDLTWPFLEGEFENGGRNLKTIFKSPPPPGIWKRFWNSREGNLITFSNSQGGGADLGWGEFKNVTPYRSGHLLRVLCGSNSQCEPNLRRIKILSLMVWEYEYPTLFDIKPLQ